MCAPDQSLNSVGAFAVTPLKPLLHPQQPPTPHNRVLAHMWQVVQNNNGIKVRGAAGIFPGGDPILLGYLGYRSAPLL